MGVICDKCGLCCQNLQMSKRYDDLNDGTGTCIHYDTKNHLCRIYKSRPTKCNIEKMYYYFKEYMSWDEYCEQNHKVCLQLKESLRFKDEVKTNG